MKKINKLRNLFKTTFIFLPAISTVALPLTLSVVANANSNESEYFLPGSRVNPIFKVSRPNEINSASENLKQSILNSKTKYNQFKYSTYKGDKNSVGGLNFDSGIFPTQKIKTELEFKELVFNYFDYLEGISKLKEVVIDLRAKSFGKTQSRFTDPNLVASEEYNLLDRFQHYYWKAYWEYKANEENDNYQNKNEPFNYSWKEFENENKMVSSFLFNISGLEGGLDLSYLINYPNETFKNKYASAERIFASQKYNLDDISKSAEGLKESTLHDYINLNGGDYKRSSLPFKLSNSNTNLLHWSKQALNIYKGTGEMANNFYPTISFSGVFEIIDKPYYSKVKEWLDLNLPIFLTLKSVNNKTIEIGLNENALLNVKNFQENKKPELFLVNRNDTKYPVPSSIDVIDYYNRNPYEQFKKHIRKVFGFNTSQNQSSELDEIWKIDRRATEEYTNFNKWQNSYYNGVYSKNKDYDFSIDYEEFSRAKYKNPTMGMTINEILMSNSLSQKFQFSDNYSDYKFGSTNFGELTMFDFINEWLVSMARNKMNITIVIECDGISKVFSLPFAKSGTNDEYRTSFFIDTSSFSTPNSIIKIKSISLPDIDLSSKRITYTPAPSAFLGESYHSYF